MYRWLSRKTDASTRHPTSQLKREQQIELEGHSVVFEKHNFQKQPPTMVPFDLQPVIVQKIERLEEILSTFFSGLSSATPNSTRTPTSESDDKTTQVPSQSGYTNNQTDPTIKDILIAGIAHLTESKNKPSSCLDALSSSGLIDLLEKLSFLLERLYYQERTEIQLGLNMEVIQRLTFLLEQRDREIKHEREISQGYRKDMEELKEMIHLLEKEWESAKPMMARSKVYVEGVGNVIGRLSDR